MSNETPDLKLTPRAVAHLTRYLAKHPKALGVRFSVKLTGCSGYAYDVQLAQERKPDDLNLQLAQLTLLIEPKSYPFIKGSEVDYVKEGLQEKFVFRNPNETGSCGCGESFTVNRD